MANRAFEPGWERLGEWDAAQRRSLWVRFLPRPPLEEPEDQLSEEWKEWARASLGWKTTAIELCSGREGDDWYCLIDSSNPAFEGLMQVLTAQAWSKTT